jgi:oligopeptide/dipeptide ABC transporter ATP-binding protein
MLPLLRVSGLRVEFVGPGGKRIHAVNGANFEVRRGEVLGMLGESGSGKTTIAKALLQMLPRTALIKEGSIEFEGNNLLQLEPREMQKLRGARIARIPQEPGLALSPVMKVGDQIAEVIRAHHRWSWKLCREEAAALLGRVQLSTPDRTMYDAYPHQLSGGQQQRVVIAQALACQPALVIADEPTASLDTETQDQILQLLRTLRAEQETALLLITHDPRILRGFANRVAVLYGGHIVEEGTLGQVFDSSRHPYTRALLDCLPKPPEDYRPGARPRLMTIPGSAPDPGFVPAGCSFAPRCTERLNVCDQRPPAAIETDEQRRVECFLYGG